MYGLTFLHIKLGLKTSLSIKSAIYIYRSRAVHTIGTPYCNCQLVTRWPSIHQVSAQLSAGFGGIANGNALRAYIHVRVKQIEYCVNKRMLRTKHRNAINDAI